MILAAIWYSIDQNEPSVPFLLDLPAVPPDADRGQVKKALTAYFEANRREMAEEYERDNGEPYGELGPTVVDDATSYGDFSFTEDESEFLFVSLPRG